MEGIHLHSSKKGFEGNVWKMDYPLNGLWGRDLEVDPSSPLLPSSSSSYPGKVLCALVNALLIEFVDEASGETHVARACTGKLYLNGRRNLLAALRTPGAVETFLPRGTPLRIRVARAHREERVVLLRDEFGRDSLILEENNKRRPDAIKRLARTGTNKEKRFAEMKVKLFC